MKRVISILLVTMMLLMFAGTAFASADIKEFEFTLTRESAQNGYQRSREYAIKRDSSKYYASIRINEWGAIPTRTLHTGIWNNTTPYTYFVWMSPPATTNTSVRVFSKYKDAYVTYTGNSYKHYVAMRLNTEESVTPVYVKGVFTPDSK